MFRGILPKETNFFDMFEKHISITINLCQDLYSMTEPESKLDVLAKSIKEKEHELDNITHKCVEALHKTFITPFDAEDIHLLIKRLDDIADLINSATSRMVLYDIKEMRPEIKEIAQILIDSTKILENALLDLRSNKKREEIKLLCRSVHHLENVGDTAIQASISKLFKENDPMNIIKWKEILERLEKAIDRCEDVANIIEGIVIKSA